MQPPKTSIAWSKTNKLSRPSASVFNADDQIDESIIDDVDIDQLKLTKRPSTSTAAVEDRHAKAARLREKGATAAEKENFKSAIEFFNDSLTSNNADAAVWDMKAQTYMCLGEDYQAIQSAMHAILLQPINIDYRLTLARAHRNFGEIQIALRHMTYALLISPWLVENREEQLEMLTTKNEYDAKVKELADAMQLDNIDV